MDDLIAKSKRNRERIQQASPLHADVIEMLKDQLLIVFLRRLGADDAPVRVPVKEVDDTGRVNLSFSVSDGVFEFVLTRKQS